MTYRGKRQTLVPHRPFELSTEFRSRAETLLQTAFRYRETLDASPGMTHVALAALEGVSRSKISQVLMLLRLPDQVQQTLQGRGAVAELSEAELRRLVHLFEQAAPRSV